MTIFDSIKYPIKDMYDHDGFDKLPADISTYWIMLYSGDEHKKSHSKMIAHLRKLIAEYQTEECEITKAKHYDNIS
jgi:hypothetical protein